MARTPLIIALDIGTSTTQTVVAEYQPQEDYPRILGVGVAPSAGIRKGVVVDIDDASSAVRQSADEAGRAAGVAVKSAWVAVGGSRIGVAGSRGVIAVSRPDGEIAPEDVRRAIAAAETFVPRNPNREILHLIPRDFRVDQEEGVKDPVGMHGVRLEVDTLIVEIFAPALKNLFKCVEGAGITPVDWVFGPLASAEAVLTRRQKELGVVLCDIGGGTASFIVFEEGTPLHAGVMPLGGGHITNDIAIGFRTHVDIAEQIKLVHGSCLGADIAKREAIRAADFIPEDAGVFSRRELAEMIQARLGDVFELLHKELRKINRRELLPAGLVLVGGSAVLPGLCELARREIGLPVQIGQPSGFPEIDEASAPSFASVLGVLVWAQRHMERSGDGWGGRFSRAGRNTLTRWLRSLLP